MNSTAANEFPTVAGLTARVLAGEHGPDPKDAVATSVFWVQHGTRLAGASVTYRNRYLLVRVGPAFGACAVEEGALAPDDCYATSGASVAELLRSESPALRTAALDAYLAAMTPHRDDPRATAVALPAGTPERRAAARDAAVAGLLDFTPGAMVALIGVVNPLVAAIRQRGGEPLPCDLAMRTTAWGDPVTTDMHEVLARANAVIATGMTLGNGSFDAILAHCAGTGTPLAVYAQTGSAIAREFLGAGLTALSAEPFPFSQFSAEQTALYRYHEG